MTFVSQVIHWIITMASSLTQIIARIWATNEKLTSASMNDMGETAIQSAFSALGYLLRRTGDDELAAGFVADCFEPTSTGALQVTLKKGTGLFIDTTATVPFTDPVLVPLVLEADEVVNLDAHQANPRIDVIYATPAVVDFENASVRIWGGAAFSNSNEDTARKRSVTITTLKGTAAVTPVKPTIPAGSVEVAVCAVPATSGTATIADVRQLIQNGNPQGANSDHFQSWVPGSGGELLATASGSAMECSVAVGDCYANGLFYRFGEAETVSLGLSPVGDFRYDHLVVDTDGAFLIIAGTLGGSDPDPGAGQTPIASFLTLAGAAFPATTIDRRLRYPIGTDQLDDGAVLNRNIESGAVDTSQLANDSVTTGKLGFDFIKPTYVVGAEDGSNDIEIAVTTKDLSGIAVSGAQAYLVEMFDSVGDSQPGLAPAPEFISGATGSRSTGIGSENAVYTTDAAGLVGIKLQTGGLATGTWNLIVTPLDIPGAPVRIVVVFA